MLRAAEGTTGRKANRDVGPSDSAHVYCGRFSEAVEIQGCQPQHEFKTHILKLNCGPMKNHLQKESVSSGAAEITARGRLSPMASGGLGPSGRYEEPERF